jgi:Ca2+-dependent lipid-binding protein
MLTPVLRSFAPPGKEKLHGENISLIIKFFLGMHDLFHLPVPIWIAVESIVGTIRLRCQMVAQAPFIRNVTFTLMGVPAIEAVRLIRFPQKTMY